MLNDLEILDNSLLLSIVVGSSVLCSFLINIGNKNKSKIFWLIRWTIVVLLYPHKYIGEDIVSKVPFESPINSHIPIVVLTLFFLLYELFTSTKKGKKISKKFRKIPKLMSVDEYGKGQKEIIDGGSRQITEQIIDNEHELLEELVGDLSDGNLKRLNKNKVDSLENYDEDMPLANQNFPEIGGENIVAEKNQGYCEHCKEPVKDEWKACPFCGELFE